VRAIASFAKTLEVDPEAANWDWGISSRSDYEAQMDQRVTDKYSFLGEFRGACFNKAILREKLGNSITMPAVLFQGKLESLNSHFVKHAEFVLKPLSQHSAKGVLCISNGVDLLTGLRVLAGDGSRLIADVEASYRRELSDAEMIGEELCTDFAGHAPSWDFKYFVAGNRAYFIYVIDRANSRHRMFQRHEGSWRPMDDPGYVHRPSLIEASDLSLDQLAFGASMAEEIAALVSRSLLRVDLYLTPQGPVLGEITPHPNAGKGCSPRMGMLLGQLMRCYPDTE